LSSGESQGATGDAAQAVTTGQIHSNGRNRQRSCFAIREDSGLT